MAVSEFLSITVAIGSLCVSTIAFITFWMKFSDRISKADAKADEAVKNTLSAIIRIVEAEKEIVNHRVAVAKEYVSKETLFALETRIVEAINQLGNRLDSLFKGSN